MKNKKLAYVLLPLVLLIWGNLIYKFFIGTNESELIDDELFTTAIQKPEMQLKQVHFEINPNYPDPFLKRQQIVNVATDPDQVKNIIPPKVIPPAPIQQEKWPVIVYNGSIINKTTEKVVAMVKIDNSNKLLSQDDIYKEVTLSQITKDSIIVVYHEKVRTFYLRTDVNSKAQ